jgi:hypothetical protein
MPATRQKLIKRELIKWIIVAAQPGNDYGASRIELTDAGRSAIHLMSLENSRR